MATTEENLRAIQLREDQVREKFTNQFGFMFSSMQWSTNFYEGYDLLATSIHGEQYVVEIKQRGLNKSICNFSGHTYLELPKKTVMVQLYDYYVKVKHMPCNAVKCILFVYYPDGWLAYNISKRIERNSIDLNVFQTNMQSSTMNGGYMKSKDVSSLRFYKGYGDAMVYTPIIEEPEPEVIKERQPTEKKIFEYILN